ncbi:MAG: AMP-binding protein [Pseudomonadota bacterium]
MNETGYWPEFNQSFLPVLDEAFATHAERECIVYGTVRLSYAEVDRASRAIARRLTAEGFEPGMRGAVYSLNSHTSFIATLGIVRAGGVWIPVNARNAPEENRAILNRYGCDALFFQQAWAEIVEAIETPTARLTLRVSLDAPERGELDYSAWATGDAGPLSVPREGTDLFTLPLTGGTTGLPKAVMLSHRNFNALCHGMTERYGDRRVTILCAAPMTHVGGRIAVCSLKAGARFVIIDRVDPGLILELIERERITDFFLPPTGVYALLDHPRLDETDLSSLHSLSYGSAPMSLPRLKEALQRIGPVMTGGLGQTESPMFIARLQPEEHYSGDPADGVLAPDAILTSVGRNTALSELAIVDDDANPLPPGSTGEVAVRGPMVSEGYYENPEATAEIRRNGWHLTGDIGVIDEKGYLRIVDRKKDMIITGGFNVYSSEVEAVLHTLPNVALSVVVGAPSDKWGEEVVAVIVPAPGTTPDADEIIAACKEKLGGVKAPKRIQFVDELPRTPIGKIDKKAVRAPFWTDAGRQV